MYWYIAGSCMLAFSGTMGVFIACAMGAFIGNGVGDGVGDGAETGAGIGAYWHIEGADAGDCRWCPGDCR